MDAQKLTGHVERALDGLRREFEGEISAEQVTTTGTALFDQLRAEARINDFIPVLVYRYTREELIRSRRDELHRAA